MLEIVRAIAWPAVGLVISLVALFSLRGEIVNLLRRVKSVGKGTLEMRDVQQAPPPEPKSPDADRFFRTFENPVLQDREEAIRQDLDRNQLSGSDRERALVKMLAAHQVGIHFERVYNLIWASQLALLVRLSGRPLGESLEVARSYYDSAAERFPEVFSNYTFEQYLGFLEGSLLIQRRDGLLLLTPIGREFLKYLVDTAKAAPFFG